jgi:plasmid stabilization system protein ParE
VKSYQLHPEVYGDLDDIHDYVQGFNPAAADRVLDEFLVAFDLLARFPHQGHFRSDLTSKPLRFKVIQNYLIAYAYETKPLWIVAVIDGRRNPRVIASILRARE